MVLDGPGARLRLEERAIPAPGEGRIRVRVHTTALCRTDLHIREGALTEASFPLVLGHQIVGRVDALGPGVTRPRIGERVGVPWLGGTCGTCGHCLGHRENLCDGARFTGYHLDGGLADHVLCDPGFCLPIPRGFGDAEAAPLLCAGLIGFRALNLAGPARRIGLVGFGAAAHIVAQVILHRGQEFYAFTRPGDRAAIAHAEALGATWAGGLDESPGVLLDAVLVFAPRGEAVPRALELVDKGGSVILGGIHMSEIPPMRYELLWGERVLRSVANLTRADGEDFMRVAEELPIITTVTPMPLEAANDALDEMRAGKLKGAAVLVPDLPEPAALA